MDYWAYTRADSARLLSRAGITLLLIAAIRFFSEIFPLGLLLPGWYMSLARELINISPVILTGLTMYLIARRLVFRDENQENSFKPASWLHENRLLQVMAIIFALLLPLQIGAAVLFDREITNTQRMQLQMVQGQLARFRATISPVTSNPQIERLQAMEIGLKTQQRKTNRRRYALLMESLRICASAAVMVWILKGAVGFLAW